MTAERLGEAGAKVLVHGRDGQRGRQVVDVIRRRGGEAEFFPADFASLAAVREFAADVLKKEDRLHVLVNNAGIGTDGPRGQRQESTDGYELRFAVNYLAGYLLTRLLLPLLKASAPARIINVSSLGHEQIDFDDLMLTRGYSGSRAYRQSKLAQILFTLDLAEELKDSAVTVNSLHPATYMNTNMVRQSGATPINTVESGCEAILQLVTGESLTSGQFFDGTRLAQVDPQAHDDKARARLRMLSAELAGV